MEGGLLEYKCRRCGEISKNIHTPDVTLTVIRLAHSWDLPKEWFGTPVSNVDIHNCKDGGLGVADLIGGMKDILINRGSKE